MKFYFVHYDLDKISQFLGINLEYFVLILFTLFVYE